MEYHLLTELILEYDVKRVDNPRNETQQRQQNIDQEILCKANL
jgi:hypothetical protein